MWGIRWGCEYFLCPCDNCLDGERTRIELVKAKSTKEVGAVVVDDQDRTRASFGAGTDKEEAGITNELEILRGDLAQILVDQTKGKTEYMFGDRIESLQEDAEGINVRFASGSSRRFAFVFCAEGVGSPSRALVFTKQEVERRSLGFYTCYWRCPRLRLESMTAHVMFAPGKRVLVIRPDNMGGTFAFSILSSPQKGYERLPVAEQKKIVQDRFQGLKFKGLDVVGL